MCGGLPCPVNHDPACNLGAAAQIGYVSLQIRGE